MLEVAKRYYTAIDELCSAYDWGGDEWLGETLLCPRTNTCTGISGRAEFEINVADGDPVIWPITIPAAWVLGMLARDDSIASG